MESILVHPENAEQLKTVKAVLKALKVQFEPQPEILPVHVLKGLEESSIKTDTQYLFKNLNTTFFA